MEYNWYNDYSFQEMMTNMILDMDMDMDDMPDHSNGTDTSSLFCRPMMGGGGMIMYMDGFKFSLRSRPHSQNEIETADHETYPCLNLFFPDWTLDTKPKFYAAMLGIFLLAMLVEAISTFRYRVVRSVKKIHGSRNGTSIQNNQNNHTTSISTQRLRLFVTVLHGLQGLCGYLLMLATMTFSVELLLAVVLGLATGYCFFFQYEEAIGRLHVTTNPCCSFLEGEAREVRTQQEEDEEEQEERNQLLQQQQQEEDVALAQPQSLPTTRPPGNDKDNGQTMESLNSQGLYEELA